MKTQELGWKFVVAIRQGTAHFSEGTA